MPCDCVGCSCTQVRVFMEVSVAGKVAGRIVIEMYPGVAPKTVENFRCLCNGDHMGSTGKP